MKSLIKNGCVAGLVGGLALALFMVTVGRGPINDAIALEESLAAEVQADHTQDGDAATGHSNAARTHEDLFSRGVQEIGGAVGLVVFGLGVGLIFAVVLGAVSRHLRASSAFDASVRLGLIGFWTVVVVPFLKLPANPPAVGDPDTINQRTVLYFAVLLASILLTVLVMRLIHAFGLDQVRNGWLGAGVYGAGLVVIFAVVPGNPDDISAPAELVWRFRLVSLGGLAVLWAVVSLAMGTLLERQEARRRAETPIASTSSVAP